MGELDKLFQIKGLVEEDCGCDDVTTSTALFNTPQPSSNCPIPGGAGLPGPTGPAGADGAPGQNGATGAQGLQGIQGVAGPTGSIGLTGATGPTGSTGSQGTKGDKGDKGDSGATGSKGDTGSVGATGPQGAQGVQGVQGVVGPTGPQGNTGPAGVGGTNGINGRGFDKFIPDIGYNTDALVQYEDLFYESIVDNNFVLPGTDGTKWRVTADYNRRSAIDITSESPVIINWQTDIIPGTTWTYAQRHGNQIPIYQGWWNYTASKWQPSDSGNVEVEFSSTVLSTLTVSSASLPFRLVFL